MGELAVHPRLAVALHQNALEKSPDEFDMGEGYVPRLRSLLRQRGYEALLRAALTPPFVLRQKDGARHPEKLGRGSARNGLPRGKRVRMRMQPANPRSVIPAGPSALELKWKRCE